MSSTRPATLSFFLTFLESFSVMHLTARLAYLSATIAHNIAYPIYCSIGCKCKNGGYSRVHSKNMAQLIFKVLYQRCAVPASRCTCMYLTLYDTLSAYDAPMKYLAPGYAQLFAFQTLVRLHTVSSCVPLCMHVRELERRFITGHSLSEVLFISFPGHRQ